MGIAAIGFYTSNGKTIVKWLKAKKEVHCVDFNSQKPDIVAVNWSDTEG